MAELRQVPGGRETPQGELRPEVVEDEIPQSPVTEEPRGDGSNSSESKLSRGEEEELDPRIQEELEHLNQASEEINQVELQLDEARTTYRRILQESARKLNTQGSHLGSCIEKARPYYEARRLAKEAQQETQKAALRYERAVSMHNAAREMVFVAEQGVMADKNRLDPTWQEMLNHATCKVNEAEEERLRGEREHQRVTRLCQQAEARVQALQKTLRRAIGKSRPYFELKAQFSQILEEHKAKVTELEQQVAQAKTRYSVALRNLEQISEQIHARRRGLPPHPLGPRRSSPVGAEARPEEDGDSGIIEGAEGGAPEEGCSLGPAPAGDSDTLSLLSLRTVASDLQKCDSVEHLRGLSDHASLDGQGLGPQSGGRGGRHQRSISL
ncbi:SH3 binding domain protein 5 like [Phyllostomus discolor]|uniref:SH3 domain-binding protein 5 n=1 Tax=Phyllostomus discolor TaxID=89673 RepID=A0A6J2NJB4_9CHIR|nr:SH3 domain-binding protein 5-like isoform X1 [Phyllostomus discolor]XP_028390293.1 SH3 domain-binding protein 5-like isoform X1 [Phyllostomus discolor]XP_035888700.1 SH3 domain-binding protein 5-like isoform X1 [Phyllostomus discolor]KAF6096966.1 SH3 binding domain protein 5 like [Phyllostomus discolor]